MQTSSLARGAVLVTAGLLAALACALALWWLASVSLAADSPGRPQAKVDPVVRMLLARNEQSLRETGQPLNLTLFADIVGVYAGDQPVTEGPRTAGKAIVDEIRADRLGILVDIDGAAEKLEQAGAEVGTVAGDIVTARVTLAQLEAIAALPDVDYIAASYRRQPLADAPPIWADSAYVHPNLEVSVPETGADVCHTEGNDGTGVTVGVVDTGLDTAHGDFTGRIGGCYSGGPDTNGHGTHVTGIAAGDGSSSAAGYVGMAPDADICAWQTDFSDDDIIDAVSWIFTQAGASPAVVNLSLGGHAGPHDGTSLLVQGLEALLGPGKVIVASAGNEGDMAIHAGGDVPAGGSIDITFDFPPPGSPGPGITWPEFGSDIFDYWYDGGANVCLTVISPNGYSVGPVCTGDSTGIITLDGCVVIDNASTGLAPNGDNELVSAVDGTLWGCPYDMAAGTWTYRFGAAGGARIDGWAIMLAQEFNPPYGDTNMTVGIPGTANEIITVASHVTKNCWDSIDGNTYCYPVLPTIGDISPFSSKGPTRDGRQKPDISAPGQGIMSAMSAAMSPAAPVELIDPDGVHWLIQGTSMSSPHVAGAVALLLEGSPALTPAAAKTALQSSALLDSFTGPTPNNTWGAGKLRVCGGGTGGDSIGIHQLSTGVWFLRNTNSSGPADLTFSYGAGLSDVTPVVGDWNNDGTDTIGLYRASDGMWFLRNANSSGGADLTFSYGAGITGAIPVVGDWDNDGDDTIGLYRPSDGMWFLRNANSSGGADLTFSYGAGITGAIPVVGDWDNDGDHTIGLYRWSDGMWFLRNANSSGVADLAFSFGAGISGVGPAVGDWDDDGDDTIGLWTTAGTWFLRNTNSSGVADLTFSYGAGMSGQQPQHLAGNWDGS